jgi:hypothetical protein
MPVANTIHQSYASSLVKLEETNSVQSRLDSFVVLVTLSPTWLGKEQSMPRSHPLKVHELERLHRVEAIGIEPAQPVRRSFYADAHRRTDTRHLTA